MQSFTTAKYSVNRNNNNNNSNNLTNTLPNPTTLQYRQPQSFSSDRSLQRSHGFLGTLKKVTSLSRSKSNKPNEFKSETIKAEAKLHDCKKLISAEIKLNYSQIPLLVVFFKEGGQKSIELDVKNLEDSFRIKHFENDGQKKENKNGNLLFEFDKSKFDSNCSILKLEKIFFRTTPECVKVFEAIKNSTNTSNTHFNNSMNTRRTANSLSPNQNFSQTSTPVTKSVESSHLPGSGDNGPTTIVPDIFINEMGNPNTNTPYRLPNQQHLTLASINHQAEPIIQNRPSFNRSHSLMTGGVSQRNLISQDNNNIQTQNSCPVQPTSAINNLTDYLSESPFTSVTTLQNENNNENLLALRLENECKNSTSSVGQSHQQDTGRGGSTLSSSPKDQNNNSTKNDEFYQQTETGSQYELPESTTSRQVITTEKRGILPVEKTMIKALKIKLNNQDQSIRNFKETMEQNLSFMKKLQEQGRLTQDDFNEWEDTIYNPSLVH